MIHPSLIIIWTLYGVQSMKNGRQADIIEYPFIVSIQHRLFHLCSGTIIDKYHILTVAHAVASHSASGLLVVPGMSVVKWPYSTALRVKNIYPHPYFQDLTLIEFGHSNLYWDNDIAILRLNEPLPLNSFIRPVSLSTTSLRSYRCFECSMISWNYADENNLEVVGLMWDVVYMMENNRCEQWGLQILANQQCFIDLLKTAFISTEDLGSPIICGDSMVGLIVKEARQGEAMSPATMLSTLNYAAFITEVVNGGMIDVQPGEFPYVVSIWHSNKHVCSGVIVNANQVITAGQCIRDRGSIYPAKVFKIATGTNGIFSIGDLPWYSVSSMKTHPSYRRNYYANDSSWRTEHNIGLITLSRPFEWSSTVQKFRFTNDLPSQQLCQVLHWTRTKIEHGREYKRLTRTTATLVRDKPLLMPLSKFQIAATELFSFNRPEFIDIGNPIICGGHPLGIMVRLHPINVDSNQNPTIIFLRIHPYASEGFFNVL